MGICNMKKHQNILTLYISTEVLCEAMSNPVCKIYKIIMLYKLKGTFEYVLIKTMLIQFNVFSFVGNV